MKKTVLTLLVLFISGNLFAQVLLNEEFNNGMPSGWTMINDSNNPYHQEFSRLAWAYRSNEGNPAGCMATTSYFQPSAQADRWLITSRVTIPTSGYVLTFEAQNTNEQWHDHITVLVSTTGNSKQNFTPIDTVTPDDDWTEFIIDLSEYAGESVYVAFADQTIDGYIVEIDNVKILQMQENDIRFTSAHCPSYIGKDVPTTLDFSLVNKGLRPLTSFTANFSINGDTTREQVSCNVPYGESFSYTFSHRLLVNQLGEYSVSIFTTNPNDKEDSYEDDNNASFNVTVYDAEKAVPRKVLMEHFTTAMCTNCPAADTRLHEAVQGRDDIVWCSHHAGFHTDDLTIPFSSSSTGPMIFYNMGGGSFAPAIMLDRTRVLDNPDYPGPAFFPDNVEGTIIPCFNKAAEVPTYVSLSIDNLNLSGREVNFTMNGQFHADVNVSSPRLSVYLVEDSICMTQAGYGGTFWHEHVLRATITDGWGDASVINSTSEGSTFSKSFSYTIPDNFIIHHCRIIAFVNDKTSNVLNSKVLNSTISDFLGSPLSVNTIPNAKVAVYPNPANDRLFLEASEPIREVYMTNMLGQRLLTHAYNSTEVALSTENLPNGLYVVTIKTENGTSTQRVNIIR